MIARLGQGRGYDRVRMSRPTALFVALLAACAPHDADAPSVPDDLVDRYAAARCGAMFRCDCDPAGWIDLAMCTSAMHAQYDARVAALREHGGGYDAACLAAVVEYWDSPDACADPIDAPGVPYCALVQGEQGVGEACASMSTTSFSASSCAAGLHCRGGETCEPPAPGIELAQGEPCIGAAYPCTDGSYCDAATDRCALRLGAGEACDAAAACDAQTWCAGLEAPETAGTCTPRGDPGEACTGAPSWDARACAPEADDPTIAHYCVGMICSDRVPAACGPWL